MKSGNLKFLEPSGPLQECNGTALPLPFRTEKRTQFLICAVHVRSVKYGSFWKFLNVTVKSKVLERKHDLLKMLSNIRTNKLLSKPATQTLRVLYLSNAHEIAQHKLKVAVGLHTINFQMQNNSFMQNSYKSTLILKSKSSELKQARVPFRNCE